jgi:ferrochelatase
LPTEYDAILIVGFGGPERREDVLPFLENVTRARNIPRERLLAVAEHYYHFGGKSPLNDQVRELIGALRPVLEQRGIRLAIAWGNRNWHPFLADALRELSIGGARRVLALVLAAYSSYSSCRQYREDIEKARAAAGPNAPLVDKVRVFFNHPGFIAANADRLREAMEKIPGDRRSRAHVAFTTHSIPVSMAQTSRYADQLNETGRLVCERLGFPASRWALAYQSRSGRPSDPWLEPDICDHLAELHAAGVTDVALLPVGFLSDHLEVLYDLDVEAREKSRGLGMNLVRAATVGTHPQFVAALADLVAERVSQSSHRSAVGAFPAWPDVCPDDCCPAPRRG